MLEFMLTQCVHDSIPQRLTKGIGWLNHGYSSRFAARLDRENQGVAIIVEFNAAA